jgi:hypothetical protein
MTWTPPPAGTKPEPVWMAHRPVPHCRTACPWYKPGESGMMPCQHPKGLGYSDTCYPYFVDMRIQLACARRRAEAWHKSARNYRALYEFAAELTRAQERRIVELEALVRKQSAVVEAARDFVRWIKSLDGR